MNPKGIRKLPNSKGTRKSMNLKVIIKLTYPKEIGK
jgi:hypothetical protein